MAMWRTAVLLACSVAAATVLVRADDLSVVAAPGVDFSAFSTFAVHDGAIRSGRPELDNRLFAKKLGRTIQSALEARGLNASANQPDLIVDFTLTGQDFAVGERPPAAGLGPQPRRFTEGTLVIDITRSGETDPIWRGTYRDDESTGSKLVLKLPDDAKKLIDRLPTKK